MAPALQSLRGAGGLRAAWERQQRQAELVGVVERIPRQARSKPAFLAAQLQPVLEALRRAAAAPAEEQPGSPEEGEAASAHAGQPPELAAAAAHVRRLAAIDRQPGANAALLLWLLLGTAAAGEEQDGLGEPLVQLCAALGWELLLLEALPTLLLLVRQQGQPQQQSRLLADVVAAAVAAASSSGAAQQAAAERLVLCLASLTQQQLGEWRTAASGSSAAQLLSSMAALQQVLLLCPALAAAPETAAGLQRVQAAGDACMAELMRSMQQQQQQAGAPQLEQQQAVFQQLAQLRARLMLAALAGSGAGDGSASSGSDASSGSGLQIVDASSAVAAHEWRTVLVMPPAAAAGRPAVGGSAGNPTRHQFLAACVAAQCHLQATDGSHGAPVDSSSAGSVDGLATEIVELPGVRFLPPPLLAAPPRAKPDSMAAAAAAAALEVQRDPGSLEAVQLTLTALRLAQLAAPDAAASASAAGTAPGPAAAAWPVLLDLAAAAAGTASEPREQRQLLLLLLHGAEPWQQRLRCALAADQQLQQRWRRELVAVANRLASDPSTGGGHRPAVVHGEARRRRTAAAVAALLPHAILCPAAVLERLVREAVVQAGEQVALLLDVLQEMAPLAAYREDGEAQPLLLRLLARVLAPGAQQPAVLDTPASQQAFLQLASGVCGVQPPAMHGKTAAAGASGGSSKEPLLSLAAVLQLVVAPALQAGSAAEGLLLPLQLAELLVGGPAAAAGSSAALQRAEQLGGVQPVLQALLSLDARRIDRSAAALQASPEAYEQAASILQSCGAPATGAGSYFRRQLQAPPAAAHGQQGPPQPQQLQQLRQRMVQLLAALLPCLTAAEAAEVLQAALPATIQTVLLPGAAQPQGGSGAILPGAHAAAVEAACRAALALALQPAQAPVAGEEPSADEPPTAEAPPSALRQVAVERLLQHLTQHCARLATPSPAASPAAASGQPPAAEALQLGPGEAQALGLRCFRELCQLAAAAQRAGYDCATLQAGLLQLARQLAGRGSGAAPASVAAALLPAEAVQQQLAAAVGLLPEGRLRDVVLLGVEQATQL